MTAPAQGIILVGHGGVPTDYPQELVTKLKRLEGQRRASGAPPTSEELELDRKIRRWPRSPQTDPYRSGLESLAAHLRPFLNGVPLAMAYNEFCSPTLEEAVAELAADGAQEITVLSSMLTPGGSHSELEIPETLQQLRAQYPLVTLRYAWPFDLTMVCSMLAEHLRRFMPQATESARQG
jgi:sirohydrochlorin cobaltochelatase